MSQYEQPCALKIFPQGTAAFDRHARTSCLRDDSYGRGLVEMEPGVRFFIRAIETLGGRTRWSCEGHERGDKPGFYDGSFYIAFEADYRAAVAIKKLGFFSVEVEGENAFSLRRHTNEETLQEATSILRLAAKHWVAKVPEFDQHPDMVQKPSRSPRREGQAR